MTLTAIFTLYVVTSTIICGYFLDDFFGKAEMSEYSSRLRYSDIARDYDRTPISFQSGKNTLRGYIYGEENTKGLVVVSHGLGGGAEDYTDIIKYFVDNGWRVMAYDNTGGYNSDGDGAVGLAQSAIDLDAALTYIENNSALSSLPKVLIGHSWGGYAVSAVLNFEHDVKAVAEFSGYAMPLDMLAEFAGRLIGTPLTVMEYPFLWMYNTAAFGDKAGLSAIDGINGADIPVMVIHGDKDPTVSAIGAGIIAHRGEITNPNAQFVLIENRKHNDIFYSDRAIEYIQELNEDYNDLYEQFDGNIPHELEAHFYNEIDKALAGELNGELFGQINEFFENAIQ
ncbi:MAG: alpha/beta hydrolase [Eubacterium sp.]|nr:alpha/beta hydrolase [Eubacterium sp.]